MKINNKFPRWLFNWMDGELALPLVILRMSGSLTYLRIIFCRSELIQSLKLISAL